MKQVINNDLRSQIVSNEVHRITEMFGKSYLDCDDIMKLTGLGKDNARALMHKPGFPVLFVGKRQIVSVIQFVAWQLGSM